MTGRHPAGAAFGRLDPAQALAAGIAAQPAPAGELCDFCEQPLDAPPAATYRARPFTHHLHRGPVTIGLRFTHTWQACRRCAPLINRRSWQQLANRIYAVNPHGATLTTRAERAQFLGAYLRLWETFERNLLERVLRDDAEG